ncbi:MAG: sialate O-acetylesterase [Pirellulaceae bacterium]|nr:sialate O-acetylesterase [Planctomycetales bacterium]
MKLRFGALLATLGLLLAGTSAMAETKLPAVLSDHMVVQRGKPIQVWGWDDPGTEVTVSLGDETRTAKADDNGRWAVQLEARQAGGPHEIKVVGSSERTLTDILIGDVWLCSGQSNMEWTVAGSDNAQAEIAAADHPTIRHIKIPHVPSAEPQSDVGSPGWTVCGPSTVGEYTAVGYFFARHIQTEVDVPIGLIGSNWGGTRIEPWIPPQGFQSIPELKDITDQLDNFPSVNDQGQVNHQTPLALYNGMISPLLPYEIRGAIWYQGESNNGEGMLYHHKMRALINGWRDLWHNDDLPFYFVQLAPFRYGRPDQLPGIWEAQTATLEVPHTGMAVTTDITMLQDIHPRNKQDVGKRLALWALADSYGKTDLVYSGPLYREMKTDGNKVVLHFDHVGSGLKSLDGEALTWFTIAGEDGNFVEAKAEIAGDTVVVWADGVAAPKAVRMGWHEEATPNLGNAEGLPASPFRTDK